LLGAVGCLVCHTAVVTPSGQMEVVTQVCIHCAALRKHCREGPPCPLCSVEPEVRESWLGQAACTQSIEAWWSHVH
jgi:hypothetical protein